MERSERTAAVLLIAASITASAAAAEGIAGPTLTVAPETALVDEPVRIEVTGGEPGGVVVLRAVSFDDDGIRWESRATFEADAEGRVDPGALAPKSGTYDGVHPMGLFWSMRNDERPRGGFAYHELDPLDVVLQLEIDGEVRESRRLRRRRILPSVTRREVRERGLVATLFRPDVEGPVGAVVVVGGSSGGLSEGTAALLASHGFAALALAYHGEESLPDDLAEIPLEYFETAIEFLGEQGGIDADRIGVWGASRGGELALLLGATFPRVRAVVAVVPSGVVWTGCCSPQAFRRAAWTHEGEPITPLRSDDNDPDVRAHDAEVARKMQAGEPVAHAPGFRLAVEKATNLEEATIPVERTQGPILLLSGEADGLWPSSELAEIAMRRLRQNEFPFPFEHRSYEDAGHVFEHPFLPNPTISRGGLLFGGTPAGNAKAAADSWSRALAFYEEALSWREQFAHKLWLQRVDGSEGRLLEPERADVPDLSMHPRFSPDGEWLVFTSNRGGFNDGWPLSLAPQPYGDLWAVPVAGGPAVRLTDDKWEDGPNDWGYARPPEERTGASPEPSLPPPILDMHLHARDAPDPERELPAKLCLPVTVYGVVDAQCPEPLVAPATDEEMVARTVDILERHNVYGVISDDSLETVRRFLQAAPDRLIPAYVLSLDGDDLPPEALRSHFAAGDFAVLGEVDPQYYGLAPDDERLEPYWALAEELDIPVALHLGEGYPEAPYLDSPAYRVRLGSPLLLEEVLVRHPDLRLYVMHYGSPFVDEMIALMYTHPNVYVDIGSNVWHYPREYFYSHLRQLVDAGFGKRILFGSDQMLWPELIEISIEVIEEAPFLSQELKRDILYDNAARFLRLSEEEIARHHGR